MSLASAQALCPMPHALCFTPFALLHLRHCRPVLRIHHLDHLVGDQLLRCTRWVETVEREDRAECDVATGERLADIGKGRDAAVGPECGKWHIDIEEGPVVLCRDILDDRVVSRE